MAILQFMSGHAAQRRSLSATFWNPSLHIGVDHGQVTLAGVVNKMDKQLAYMAARGVPGVLAVTNDLKVESEKRARKGSPDE